MKFPKHKAGLSLTHNDHKNYYENIYDFIGQNDLTTRFENKESKMRSIETDSIWVLRWYPDTPIGFCIVVAPTLEEVLALSLKESPCQD